jgi:hypothetical protein
MIPYTEQVEELESHLGRALRSTEKILLWLNYLEDDLFGVLK